MVSSSSFPLPSDPSLRFIPRSCYPVQKQLVFQAEGVTASGLCGCVSLCACVHGWRDERRYSLHSHPGRFRPEIRPFDLSMASQGEESKSHDKYPVAKTFVCIGVLGDTTSGFLSWIGTFSKYISTVNALRAPWLNESSLAIKLFCLLDRLKYYIIL